MGTNLFIGGGSGVYLSTNNGTSWTPVNSGLWSPTVWSLAVSGTNLFAGTGGGGGVFLSADSGASWTGLYSSPTTTDVFALATSGGNLFAGTNGSGVFLSTDKGTTWAPIDSGLTNMWVWSLAFSGTNLFAGTLGGGVLLSTNNGRSWTAVNSGLPLNTLVYSFAVSGTKLFVGTGDGVFLRPLSEIVSVKLSSNEPPTVFRLEQNYPNPFNPTTTIRYALPGRVHVTLTVFNALGQEVATLVNDSQDAGYHDVRFDASGLASGVYFYQLRAGDYVATKKLLVLR
jgi:hypothetical protein